MPDHKEMGREPTEREREGAFAPHQSPKRQGDGDPGRKVQPQLIHDEENDAATESEEENAQADGDTR